MHELACTRCGRLGAAIARNIAEQMEHDEALRALVWRELATPETPTSPAIDIRRRSSPRAETAPAAERTAATLPLSTGPPLASANTPATWLATSAFDRFRSTYWRSAPYAESQAAQACIPLLTVETVDRLLDAGGGLDVLVVRDGRLLTRQAHPSSDELPGLLRQGCSLVIRHAEAHDRGLAELARLVEAQLSGKVAIQLYMTPGSRHSFGWHYDAEDVLIVQTEGTKEYLFRQNTVNPHPSLDAMPEDMEYERETSPTQSCTLAAGDWLYLPSGWWHAAHALSNSLSISIGILPHDES